MTARPSAAQRALAWAVGERIRDLRLRLGWSQALLSREVGVTQAALSNYEHGRRVPPLPVVIRLAEVAGTSVDRFVQVVRR